MNAASKSDVAPERSERAGDVAIIVVVFVVLFGYQVLTGVANLTALPSGYEVMGIADAVPYPLLIASIAVPALLFIAGLWVSRKLRLVPRAGVLLLALATSAQLSLLFEELQRQIATAALLAL